jgi:hypothetical protein
MDIPIDVLKLTASFLVKPKMKLLDWIQIDKLDQNWLLSNPCEAAINVIKIHTDKMDFCNLFRHASTVQIIRLLKMIGSNIESLNEGDWQVLSFNPNAIDLLEANFDKINWRNLSRNPNAIHLLENNLDKIDWELLSVNSNAIHLLEKHFEKIDWSMLSFNCNAIHLLEKHLDKIDWRHLSINTNTSIIDALLKTDFNNTSNAISWYGLSMNPNAIHILEKYPEKINWWMLSKNQNAIHLLEANPDKILWNYLSENSNAIHLLKAHYNEKLDESYIDWRYLSINPSIFEIDNEQLKIDVFKKANIIDYL